MVPNKRVAAKGNSGIYLKVAFSVLGGFGAAAISFCFFAWLLSRSNLPLYMAVPFSTVSVCIGAFWGAFFLCRLLTFPSILTGLLSGILSFAVFMAAAFLEGVPELTGITPLRLAALLAAGLLGAVMAKSRKKKPRLR